MFRVKRSREDDGPELDHRHKLHKFQKHTTSSQASGLTSDSTAGLDLDFNQSLPFRAPTLTPVDSDDEGPNPKKHGRQDNSMGNPTKSLQNPWLSVGSTSHSMKPLSVSGGNVPRPNYSNSNSSSLPHNTPDASLSNQSASPTIPVRIEDPTTQSCMEGVAYGKENSRVPAARLPSPISDDDHDTNMDSAAPSDADMTLYSQSPYNSPVPGCAAGNPFLKPALPHPSTPYDSDDTIHRNSTQTRKKPTLVMGYRADCDKCRRQVPGHYSHIIH